MNTIVAFATPVGRSAIGVLRLSGPESLDIVRSMCGEDFDPRPGTTSLRNIKDPTTGDLVDHALVTFFAGPKSYTGEDVVELSCHGSVVILRQVLDLALQLGARVAEPGEFTLRALGNGKISLSQAEAVRDLVDARTADAAKQALRQLDGELAVTLSPMKDELLKIIVLLETALEFAEEDVPELQKLDVRQRLSDLDFELQDLAATYSVGHLLAQGLKVVIVGRPNVGKSSLFNKLVGLERAIVTEIPGTTRDSIGEEISIEGFPVSLVDTAGLRESGDRIESIGIERTRSAIADADLSLVVLDGSEPLQDEDREVLTAVRRMKHLVVVNKCDVVYFANPFSTSDTDSRCITVSALTGVGLDRLRAAILEPFRSVDAADEGLLITNARHHDLLRRAHVEVQWSMERMQDAGEEVVLVGLHNALRLLGEITGETTAEDILSRIFSTFCIGK
jgi:tRNA modification GTPase